MWTTIGARLLNLFLRNLVCVGTLKSFRFLVGGGWNNGSSSGLWYWNFNENSSAYGVVGARLLSLIMGLDVYECCFTMSYALVGGMYWDTLKCGLWYWNVNNASSNCNVNIGARLIIWDLMCMSSTLYIVFLSAVLLMVHLPMSACGIGGLLKIHLIMELRPVLDHLYKITYTSFSSALAEN